MIGPVVLLGNLINSHPDASLAHLVSSPQPLYPD